MDNIELPTNGPTTAESPSQISTNRDAAAELKAARVAIITSEYNRNPKATFASMKSAVGTIGSNALNDLMRQVRRDMCAPTEPDVGHAGAALASMPSSVRQAMMQLEAAVVAAVAEGRQQAHEAHSAHAAQERAKFDDALQVTRAKLEESELIAEELARTCDERDEASREVREQKAALEQMLKDHVGLLSHSQSLVEDLTRRSTRASGEQAKLREDLAVETARVVELGQALAAARAQISDLHGQRDRAVADVGELRAELVACSARRAAAEDAVMNTMAALTARFTPTDVVAGGPAQAEVAASRATKRNRARVTNT